MDIIFDKAVIQELYLMQISFRKAEENCLQDIWRIRCVSVTTLLRSIFKAITVIQNTTYLYLLHLLSKPKLYVRFFIYRKLVFYLDFFPS